MLCPKTLKGCCDDLCYGSGCLLLDGADMIPTCYQCGAAMMDHHDEPDMSGFICEACALGNVREG